MEFAAKRSAADRMTCLRYYWWSFLHHLIRNMFISHSRWRLSRHGPCSVRNECRHCFDHDNNGGKPSRAPAVPVLRAQFMR